jgi:LPXTG-site transpeptidase (sortase) family protein
MALGCLVLLLALFSLTPGSLRPDPAVAAQAAHAGERGIVARSIRIPRLGLDAPIVPGDPDQPPENAIAHYGGTAWPRGGSNIYLFGHARDGLFLALWSARTGDTIELDLVDGTVATYRVEEIHPVARWDDVAYLDPTPTEQLTLQTCVAYETTSPRFVVIARPTAPPA